MDKPLTPPETFRQLASDEWEFRLREDPLFATAAGDHRYDDRLPHANESDYARRLRQMCLFRDRARAIDRSALLPADRLNFDIFVRWLDAEIGELEFHAYRLPISKVGGFHLTFPELFQLVPLDTRDDYEHYLARLHAFQPYVLENIVLMRGGLEQGQAPPRTTLDGVASAVRAQVVAEPEQSLLFTPFRQFPPGVAFDDRQRLAERGRLAIRQSVVPGFAALAQFLDDEYLRGARDSISAADLPQGADFYRHRIRYYTSLDLTPQAVHATGLAEVERIRQEMQAAMRQAGFAGSLPDFVRFLRSDPRFYAETPDALLKEVAYVLKRMDGELPRLFGTLPRTPYGIRPIPDFSAPGNLTAYYQPAPGDGSRAGVYYVNTYDLKSRPLYEVEPLSFHEAVPGHHLQIALQQELPALPNFRRFGGFTAFVEGWALYAERLGLEAGFYADPYSNFGRLSYEMWRACRLVVDTGLHALGWTRQQAIDFMAAHTASTLLNIANEVDRYIAWPGQALAYKIGELKIREVRSRAEQALGGRFDRRAFHDVLLGSGAVPLDVLDDLVSQWLAGQGRA